MTSVQRALIVVVTSTAALLGCASAAAAGKWVVHGAGWGHGVGMSAYGALGFGKHGYTYKEIIDHYFEGLEIKALPDAPLVRVLLDATSGDVSFSGANAACGRNLDPSRSYRAVREGSSVRLQSASAKVTVRCGKSLRATGTSPIEVQGFGRYRGALKVVATGAALNVVNVVDINDYARGSVPAELPPSWPKETLRAMAVAARSIALSTDVGGDGFDIYSDTRTQLYEGADVESKRTDRAVLATRDEVATYKGDVAQTTYFSSSGGRTESRFPGGPSVPYLVSVKDPHDALSPDHRWTVEFSEAELDQLLAAYADGSVREIRVTKRGDSPRIETARLVGSGGTTTVRGETLQAALGLRSRWAFFAGPAGRPVRP